MNARHGAEIARRTADLQNRRASLAALAAMDW
jgi:hypothetical protein